MGLQEEIDKARQDIKTDSYSMSIGEWINIYKNNEIDIHPEFQRFFRWTSIQKSRLIESILLGIPIPPIFVSQREDGIWDVVDGLQRLSTIYQFVGVLRDETGKLIEPLVLERTEYLPSLEGMMWVADENERSFSPAQQLLIKRSKIDVSIILRESADTAKYELFQRLNTGGSHLSDQEVRNAILVMLNKTMFNWILELSQYSKFREVVALSDRALDQRYDMELVLRFLAIHDKSIEELKTLRDIGEFLTEQVRSMAEDKSYNMEEKESVFKKTFSIIYDAIGSDAFRRYDPNSGKYSGGFLVSAYEAIAIAIGHQPDRAITGESLAKAAKEMWFDTDFISSSGSGIRASSRIPKVINYGRRKFLIQ